MFDLYRKIKLLHEDGSFYKEVLIVNMEPEPAVVYNRESGTLYKKLNRDEYQATDDWIAEWHDIREPSDDYDQPWGY